MNMPKSKCYECDGIGVTFDGETSVREGSYSTNDLEWYSEERLEYPSGGLIMTMLYTELCDKCNSTTIEHISICPYCDGSGHAEI